MTGIEHGQEHGDETRAGRVPGHLHVQTLRERRRLEAFVHERAEDGERERHQQRRGAPLPRHVAQRDHEAAIGHLQHIVEVTAHGVGRTREPVSLEPAAGHHLLRQHGALDVARDLQIALQRETVRHFQHHQQVHGEEAADQPQRALRPCEPWQGQGQHERDERARGRS